MNVTGRAEIALGVPYRAGPKKYHHTQVYTVPWNGDSYAARQAVWKLAEGTDFILHGQVCGERFWNEEGEVVDEWGVIANTSWRDPATQV